MRFVRYLPDLAVLASLALIPLMVHWVFPNRGVSDRSHVLFGLPLLFGFLLAVRPEALQATALVVCVAGALLSIAAMVRGSRAEEKEEV